MTPLGADQPSLVVAMFSPYRVAPVVLSILSDAFSFGLSIDRTLLARPDRHAVLPTSRTIPAAQQFAASVYDGLTEFRHERAGYDNDVVDLGPRGRSVDGRRRRARRCCCTIRQDPQAAVLSCRICGRRDSNRRNGRSECRRPLDLVRSATPISCSDRRTAFLREHLGRRLARAHKLIAMRSKNRPHRIAPDERRRLPRPR